MEVLSTSFTLLLFRIIENVVLYVWESFKQYKMDAWRFPFHFLCLGVATWVFCRRLPLLPVLVRPFQDSLCVSLSTLGSDTNLNSINHEWERLYIHSGSVALCTQPLGTCLPKYTWGCGLKKPHSLKAESYVLFGGHNWGLKPGTQLSVALRACSKEVREEPGHKGVFATKTR